MENELISNLKELISILKKKLEVIPKDVLDNSDEIYNVSRTSENLYDMREIERIIGMEKMTKNQIDDLPLYKNLEKTIEVISDILQYIQSMKIFPENLAGVLKDEIDKLNLYALANDVVHEDKLQIELNSILNNYPFLLGAFVNRQGLTRVKLGEKLNEIEQSYNQKVKSLEDKLNDFESRSLQLLQSGGERIDKFYNGAQDRINILEADFNNRTTDMKNDASKLLNSIGNAAMNENYHSAAIAADEREVLWQVATLVLIFLLLVCSYQLGLPGEIDANVSWSVFASKIVFISMLGVAVKYSANQVAYTRKVKDMYRAIDFELNALGPYLANLKEDDVKEIKAKLAERYFCGRNSNSLGECESLRAEHWGKGLYDLLKTLVSKGDGK